MRTKLMAWSRNPLRRASDRIEAGVTYLLIMAMLSISPWASWSAAQATYRHDVRLTAWERQHRFPVTAVLMQDAPEPVGATDAGMPPPVAPQTAARWTGPDGVIHNGTIDVDAGMRRGSTVPIWVDDDGAVAMAPGRRSATGDAVAVAVAVVLGLAVGLGGIHRIVVVWWLDRRRLRSWQAEWLVVGPRWSHR
jgi:hypothetical protein